MVDIDTSVHGAFFTSLARLAASNEWLVCNVSEKLQEQYETPLLYGGKGLMETMVGMVYDRIG